MIMVVWEPLLYDYGHMGALLYDYGHMGAFVI